MALRTRFPGIVTAVAGPLGQGLVRLGIGPNTVTTLGLVLTALAAVAVGLGEPLVGGLLFFLGGSMDALDGTVARASGRSTPFGGFYDSVSDRLSDGMILAGVAWSVAGDPLLLGLTLIALVTAEVTSYVRARAEAIDLECEVGILERAERGILILIGLLAAPVFAPVLWVLAIGGAVTVVQRVHHVWCQIDRDLPDELMALAHADRAWSRPFVRTARAFYGERNFDEAFGGGLEEVLGEGLAERLRERLATRLRTTSEGRVGTAMRRAWADEDGVTRDPARGDGDGGPVGPVSP